MTPKAEAKPNTSEVLDTPFQDVVKTNFLNYALAVIQGRALPAVTDGLKPVQRRILWAMHQGRYVNSAAFVKSARVVGDVIGKYHPHADGAIYSTLVNMTSNYMLESIIASQGNFGIRGEDDAAAMRYTECKLHPNAETLYLRDLTEDCVDYVDNYDQSLKEPTSLPTRLPVLLVNGSFGIAVGVATNIPSHPVSEVVDMTIAVIEGNIDKAIKAFNGPDWVSGGKIYLTDEVRKSIFHTGNGRLSVYGKIETFEGNGKTTNKLCITELPWTISKPRLMKQLLELEKEIPDIQITSSAKPSEPKITIRTKESLDRVEKLLFKKTGFQSSYTYNCVFLDGKVPVRDGILSIIQKWHAFRLSTLRRKFTIQKTDAENDLDFYKARKKLTELGILAFIQILTDESTEAAEAYLIDIIGATKASADRLLAQRISTLSKSSTIEAEKKILELNAKIEGLTKLIENQIDLDSYIVGELKEIKKLSAPRRTEVLDEEVQDLNFVSTKLETRSIMIKGTKLILDSGERFSLTDSLISIHNEAVARIRIKDLRTFKTGVTVDVDTLQLASVPSLGVFHTGEVFVVYSSGRVFKLSIDKLKVWKTKPLEDGKIVAILPVMTENIALVLKTVKNTIVVNSLKSIPDLESRAMLKFKLSSAEVVSAELIDSAMYSYNGKVLNLETALSESLHSSPFKETKSLFQSLTSISLK